MKRVLPFLIIPFLFACSSGYRQLNKGNYFDAAQSAIKRLKRDPEHGKSAHVLEKAYALQLKTSKSKIQRLNAGNTAFRYDLIVSEYELLNHLRNDIENCPACLSIVPEVQSFDLQLENARTEAAKEHFSEGIRLMEGDMVQARQAYHHFSRTKHFRPDFDRVDEWLQASLNKATLRVIIQPIPMHSAMYDLTNAFFEQQIIEFARGLNYTFVQFMSQTEATETNLEPHQHIVMRFDDFVVGQMLIERETQEIERDSVKVGEVTLEGGKKLPAYGTVKANFTRSVKTLKSTGLLDFKIVDHQTGAIIRQQKFPGTHVWQYEWGQFNGDERALSEDQLALSQKREIQPPPPQSLFMEFTRPIFSQISNIVRREYNQWR